MNHMINTGTLCILSCHAHSRRINIVSLNICLYRQIYKIICLVHRIIPGFLWNQIFPTLRQEASVHAWRHIRCHHSCFNCKGTASAEWINKNTILLPWGQHNQCTCKCLTDWCLCCTLTISSLMKTLSCGVDADGELVLHGKYSYWIRCTCLRNHLGMVCTL